MTRRPITPALLFGLFALAACDRRWQDESTQNEGILCFELQGDFIEITVKGSCLSGSCSRNIEGACEVTRNASTIEVTSELSWQERGGACTDDCVLPEANCLLRTPPDGRYTVVHGGETFEIAVPDVPACQPQ